MLLIVHHTELAWRHAMYWLFGMYGKSSVFQLLNSAWQIAWCMSNLKRYVLHRHLACQVVEVVYYEVLLIGSLRVVAMAHIQNVIGYILLYNKPRTAAKAKTLALTNSVEPQSTMLANTFARFHLHHISRLLAKVSAYVFVVVNLS